MAFNSLTSKSSQRTYACATTDFVEWYFGADFDLLLGRRNYAILAIRKNTKPYLHLGFVCTVLDNTPLKHLTYHKPTIDAPYEFSILGNFVPVLISEVFIFDARTGVALLRFHPDNATDANLQKQTR